MPRPTPDPADSLLASLGARLRERDAEEQARLDDRWDALAADTLTPAERDALVEEAQASDEGRMALEAFTPLGPAFQAKLLHKLKARRAAGPEVGEPGEEASDDRGPEEEPTADTGGRGGTVVPMPIRSGPGPMRTARPPAWRRFAALAAVLVAAVSGWFLVARTDSKVVPHYAVEVTGGAQPLRGDDTTDAARLVTGTRVSIVLRPSTTVEGEIDCAMFLALGGEVVPWPIGERAEIAASGAIRIAGRLGDELPLRPGATAVLAAVGRPGDLPEASAVAARLRGETADGDDGWRLAQAPIAMLVAP